MKNIIQELDRMIQKPQLNDDIMTFDHYRKQYRSRAFGPQMAVIEEQYESTIKQMCDKAASAHKSHVHCVNVIQKILGELDSLIENPDRDRPIATFEQYLINYRNTARGSELTPVEEQYAPDLRQLRDRAKTSHDSYVHCTDEMEKLLTKLKKDCKEPQNNTNVVTLDDLFKEYRRVATRPQNEAVESQYKDRLRAWSDKASEERCEYVIKEIFKKLDVQINEPNANDKIPTFEELLNKYRNSAGGSKLSAVKDKHESSLKNISKKAQSVHNAFVRRRSAMYTTGAIAASAATVVFSPATACALLASSALYIGHYAYTKRTQEE